MSFKRVIPDWIINDSDFGKIKSLTISPEAIKEFITNCIFPHPNAGLLLQHFSELYVIVASNSAQRFLRENEKKWIDIMNTEQHNLLISNSQFIFGYIWIDDEVSDTDQNHYIEFIDTRIRGIKLARYMSRRYRYEIMNECNWVLPKQIIETAAGYWDIELFDLADFPSETLQEIKTNLRITKHIDWEHLQTYQENLICEYKVYN